MNEFLHWMITISIYSAVIFAVLLLFRKAFAKKCSASFMAAIWSVLLLRLLIPVTFEAPFHLLPQSGVSLDLPAAHAQVERQNLKPSAEPMDYSKMPIRRPVASVEAESAPASAVSSMPVSRPFSLTWQQGILLVYGAGAGICIAYKLRLVARFRRQMRRAVPVSDAVMRTAAEYAHRVGVRLPRKIWAVPALETPALTVSVRPSLLLPFGLEKVNEGTNLEYALMHELTHLRRFDHLTTLLMHVLEVVYWFNPVVWAAFRLAREDMEDACDARVSAVLSNADRAGYAHMLIKIAAGQEAAVVLGMATSRPARELARRVKNIFSPRKTGRSAKLGACVLAGILMVACFTTACQPTPEIKAVQAKTLTSSNASSVSTASAAQDPAPTKWTESLTFAAGPEVTVDARVQDHGMQQAPVLSLTEKLFTNADIERIMSALFGDLQVYEPARTKTEIEQDIIELKGLMAEEPDPLLEPEIVEENKRGYASLIAEYEDEYASAPAGEQDLEKGQCTLQEGEDGSEQVSLMVFPEGTPVQVTFANHISGTPGSMFTYSDMSSRQTWTHRSYQFMDPEKVENTQEYETDLAAAEAFLDSLGIDYMQLDWVSSGAAGEGPVEYEFCFTRSVGPLMEANYQSYEGGTFGASEIDGVDQNVASKWDRESCRIRVREGTVVQANWYNPANAEQRGETAVLSFEEAKDLAIKQLDQRFGVKDEGERYADYYGAQKFVVTNAELVLTKVKTAGSGGYELIPAWSFSGYRDVDLYEQPAYPGEFTNFVMINATDGSTIDMGLMY